MNGPDDIATLCLSYTTVTIPTDGMSKIRFAWNNTSLIHCVTACAHAAQCALFCRARLDLVFLHRRCADRVGIFVPVTAFTKLGLSSLRSSPKPRRFIIALPAPKRHSS